METIALEASTTAIAYELTLATSAQADIAAFAAIYDHFFRRVYNYVRYRVGDAAEADDLTAQVFERVLRHLPSYRAKRGPFAAWLFRIARNTVYDELRRRQRHPWLPLETIHDHIDDQVGPDEEVAAKLERARVLGLIAALPERKREIIALKFGAGLTSRHIADLMKLSESNVGVILYRALNTLRSQLAEGG